MDDYTKKFKMAKIARLISIITYISTVIPLMFFEDIGIFLSLGLLVIGFIIGREYRCPYCNHIFDLRVASRKLNHCNSCGAKL